MGGEETHDLAWKRTVTPQPKKRPSARPRACRPWLRPGGRHKGKAEWQSAQWVRLGVEPSQANDKCAVIGVKGPLIYQGPRVQGDDVHQLLQDGRCGTVVAALCRLFASRHE